MQIFFNNFIIIKYTLIASNCFWRLFDVKKTLYLDHSPKNLILHEYR